MEGSASTFEQRSIGVFVQRSVWGLHPPASRLKCPLLAREYLASNPGPDTAAPNTAVHSRARKLIKRALPLEEVKPLVNVLIHRGEMITMVEAYLKEMRIYTIFRPADRYEHQEWKFNPGNADLQAGWLVAWRELMDHIDNMFPRPPLSLGPSITSLCYTLLLRAQCAHSTNRRSKPTLTGFAKVSLIFSGQYLRYLIHTAGETFRYAD